GGRRIIKDDAEVGLFIDEIFDKRDGSAISIKKKTSTINYFIQFFLWNLRFFT
ncbi:unnamed protein product, partial [Rotaria sordida]